MNAKMKSIVTLLPLMLMAWSGTSLAEEHGAAEENAAAEAHAEAGSHADSHGGHGSHHEPHFSDINWFTGLVGEKEGVEPGLMWRAPGTPVPLGALFLNTAILFFLIGRLGGPAISSGLKSRKERIAGDMQRAAAMKAEAETQLAEYEGKLSEMAAEMTRIKKEMALQAEHERERVLEEARARATAIEMEAKQIVEQQLVHARHEATKQVVASAMAAARAEIEKGLELSDQERLASDLLSSVDSHFKGTEMRS